MTKNKLDYLFMSQTVRDLDARTFNSILHALEIPATTRLTYRIAVGAVEFVVVSTRTAFVATLRTYNKSHVLRWINADWSARSTPAFHCLSPDAGRLGP